jgi:hypothetical protein
MTEAPVTTRAPGPEGLMPGVAVADTRPGYNGVIVPPEQLLEFAQGLRDRHGYDYLSSVTGVDYLPEDKLEVVYHVYPTGGGPGLVFKTRSSRPCSRSTPAWSCRSVRPGIFSAFASRATPICGAS